MKILVCLSLLSLNGYAEAESASDIALKAKARVDNAKAKKIELANVATEKSEAAGNITAASSAECEKTKADLIQNFPAEPNSELNVMQDGDTGPMKNCVKLSRGWMRSLYKNGSVGAYGKPFPWNNFVVSECAETSFKEPKCDEAYRKCYHEKLAQAGICDGVAFLISAFGREWTNPEHAKTDTVKGGTPPITCQGAGVATVDYDACVKFVQDGDFMEVAQTAIAQGQDLYLKDKTISAQMEASTSKESATAGLKAMGTSLKGQQDIMNQRAALDTGKLALLVNYYNEIPTYDDLAAKCIKYKSIAAPEYAESCNTVVSKQQMFGILMNQTAKEKMRAKLAKVGIDVASKVIMSNMLGKRLNDVNNAITQVDAFKPIDPLAPAADDAQSTYCQQNPGDAKCLTGGLERTFDAMDPNVISFGEGGTGASFSNNNPFVDPSAGTVASSSNPVSKNSIGSVGSVINSAHQNGGLESTAGRATVSKGSAPAGGGGGGAGGGGSGGGGSGGGAPGGQAQGGTSAAIQGRTPSYGGGSGTLSMMGGLGINKSKSTAKDDGNPFGKLFNKDGNKSGTVNFANRTPASVGTKGDNLFDMISKRYTTVSSDKRLIEYEQLTK